MRISLRGIVKSPHFNPLLLVTAVSILMIILPSSAKTTISRWASNSVLFPFIEIDKFLTRVSETSDENIIINRRLSSLAVEVASLLENKQENARLRRMLDFNFELPYRLVPAEILAIPPGGNVRTVLIDAGRKRGVGVNMPVISPSGIIGKTISADEKSSTVQLLLDPGCKVAARDQRSRAMGVVQYIGGEQLSLTRVPADQDVAPGDTVISSGLGGIFPSGLFIGTVTRSEAQPGELFKEILIQPGADFSIIEEVFVIVSNTGD